MVNEGMLMEPGAVHARAKMSWQQVNLRKETTNAFQNWQMIHDMHNAGRIKSLSEIPRPGGPAMIIGSGSSLDKIIDDLVNWPYPIFCSTSHGVTLLKHGRPPEYMCILDPQMALKEGADVGLAPGPHPFDELKAPLGGWENTCLLAHPSAPFDYLKTWFEQSSRPVYMFRILEPTYDWYTHHLRWAYPWVDQNILPFIDSGASAISLATKLGYNPLYFAGIDYGGKRFTEAIYKGDGQWGDDPRQKNIEAHLGAAPEHLPLKAGVIVGLGGLESSETMEYTQRGTLVTSFTAMRHEQKQVRVYLLSDHSNMTPFIPVLEWDNLKANHWEDGGPWPAEFRQKWTDQIEIYLAHHDTFMVPLQSGFPFTDWRVYMMHHSRSMDALAALSQEILVNKANFERMEKQFNMTVREMIEKDLLTIEKGEMLIHDAEERKEWDWRLMKPIDVEAMTRRIAWLMESEPPKPPDKLRVE